METGSADMKLAHGFEEIPHTADWSIRVWAEDLPGLLEQAAQGMNSLAGVQLQAGPRIARALMLEAPDAESLLVVFLSELLYMQEQDALGFDEYKIRVVGNQLSADFEGAPLASLEKSIKAVTYHNLNIMQTARGYEVEIVFDV